MQEVSNALFQLSLTVIFYLASIGLFFLTLWIFFSNPFRRWTIVRSVFSSILVNNQLLLLKSGSLTVHTSVLWRLFGWIKSGAHIFKNVIVAAPKAKGLTVEEVIAEIHQKRFNPQKPFLISGDHFSVYYPRNLGIFYNAIMDPRVALNEDDWINREKKYLQSTAYALESFTKAKNLATTIVPLGLREVTQISIFAYPSDSLYGVLYALRKMITNEDFENSYPFRSKTTFQLHTKAAANELIQQYKQGIRDLYSGYKDKVFDTKTGLVKKDIRLSSALDTKIRSSAFYDNVVFWKTSQLIDKLGIMPIQPAWLDELKKRILTTFWDEKNGVFRDDLAEEDNNQISYASDWSIVMLTGFLNPAKKTELPYFIRSIEFVQSHKLDQPFPLKVLGSPSAEKDHFWVRTFVPNYQDNAIWSNLGIQYIKILIAVAISTKLNKYEQQAERALEAYRNNIIRYKGYPELYDSQGNMMKTRFYRSILQTGWVVDFEHAAAFFKASLHP